MSSQVENSKNSPKTQTEGHTVTLMSCLHTYYVNLANCMQSLWDLITMISLPDMSFAILIYALFSVPCKMVMFNNRSLDTERAA